MTEAGGSARTWRIPPVGVPFEPHPRAVFRPDDPPFRLTPRRAKLELFATLGVAATVVFRFHRAFAAIAAEAFVRDMLVGGLGVRHIVVGDNFHFGRGRAGNPTMLIEQGAKLGFGVTAVPPARDTAGATYSSSRARDLLRVGGPEAAAANLGRPLVIFDHVRHGAHRSPTA